MSLFRALLARHEARSAMAVWAGLPTLFLFFAITLAVDPSTQLGKVRLGVAVLDSGVQTPQGQVVVGSRLLEGMGKELPVTLAQFKSESELRDAVFAHQVAAGIIFPEDLSRGLLAKQPVTLKLVKSDANDAFTGAFVTNLASQLGARLNATLPAMLAGGQAAGRPAAPLVTVATDNVATSQDFRFGVIPAVLVLPLWVATLAFSVLLSRAGMHLRREGRYGALELGMAELGISVVGAAIAAGVITLDIALFAWRWDIDFAGLFGFLWLGLLASAWLLQGAIRLFGLELGALLGVLALFVQQPVSGAAFPPAFAPDAVSWAESVSPLRYIVEGVRNLLIGGSTTPDMAWALVALAGAGFLLFAVGVARVALMPGRERRRDAPAPASHPEGTRPAPSL
jgi:uncharacterized phage infection (PIP) family protein YhgE